MKHLSTVIQSSRPPFLLLALVCVVLGLLLAIYHQHTVNTIDILLASIGAVLSHAAVNLFNEYFDCKSGLDACTTRTPFSGGSGALLENPSALKYVLYCAIACVGMCFIIGVYFWQTSTTAIIPIGILGVLVIVLYTSVINKHPWLCWLSPGLGFGTLITLGVFIVLGGNISWFGVWCSMLPFLLANNLLLLNQFPDIDADKAHGRNTLPIAKGTVFCLRLYGLTFTLCIALIVSLFIKYQLHIVSLITILPLIAGLVIYTKLSQSHHQTESLVPLMGVNVAITLITPIIFAAGLWLS